MNREEPQGRSGSLVPRAHLSLLRQIGRLGAENAARSLSFLLGRKGELKISQVLPLHFNEITEYLGGAEERVVTVFARFEGNISGNMLYVLHEEDARGIIAALSDEGEEGKFSEMELSLMQEVGNILIGSYITALSDFLALELKSSVPALAVDMAGAILSFSLSEIGRSGDTAIVMSGGLSIEGKGASGHLFLLPDPQSLEKIFEIMGLPANGNS